MAANDVFIPVAERGWRQGLRNLLRVENGKWFRTKTWWVMGLIWIVVINGILAGILWMEDQPDVPAAAALFSLFMGLFPNIAVIIIMQDAIVSEKESGTAAWIMSKPVSRSAFVLSKLGANMLGVLAAMVILPAAVAYLQLSLADSAPLPVLNFVGGLGVIYLNMVFYLTLTLMLGTFFDHRGPVIGIPLALAFGQQLIFGILPFLANILPWTLTIPYGDIELPFAAAIISGEMPHAMTPLYFALIMSVVFVALSLWRFEREEF
ncbi:MAG: ABC transporter permease [Anaerolineales bacterium]|nr:ABC transporter permease [Anaerolineales bacterium]